MPARTELAASPGRIARPVLEVGALHPGRLGGPAEGSRPGDIAAGVALETPSCDQKLLPPAKGISDKLGDPGSPLGRGCCGAAGAFSVGDDLLARGVATGLAICCRAGAGPVWAAGPSVSSCRTGTLVEAADVTVAACIVLAACAPTVTAAVFGAGGGAGAVGADCVAATAFGAEGATVACVVVTAFAADCVVVFAGDCAVAATACDVTVFAAGGALAETAIEVVADFADLGPAAVIAVGAVDGALAVFVAAAGALAIFATDLGTCITEAVVAEAATGATAGVSARRCCNATGVAGTFFLVVDACVGAGATLHVGDVFGPNGNTVTIVFSARDCAAVLPLPPSELIVTARSSDSHSSCSNCSTHSLSALSPGRHTGPNG